MFVARDRSCVQAQAEEQRVDRRELSASVALRKNCERARARRDSARRNQRASGHGCLRSGARCAGKKGTIQKPQRNTLRTKCDAVSRVASRRCLRAFRSLGRLLSAPLMSLSSHCGDATRFGSGRTPIAAQTSLCQSLRSRDLSGCTASASHRPTRAVERRTFDRRRRNQCGEARAVCAC